MSADSYRELRLLSQTVVCATAFERLYVCVCRIVVIENSIDCVMENCRPNNVDREECEKERQGDRNIL